MVFEHKKKSEIFKVPSIEEGSNVYFQDIVGSNDKDVRNPIVGSWFRMEEGAEATPPKCDYDETGVVVEGTLSLRDEGGQSVTLGPGDTFIIHRGSTITFSSSNYGLAFKSGSRLKANL